MTCMILFPNRADAPKGALPGASITGPASALPVTNLQNRSSSKVWRSVDAQPANTQFLVRLNAQKEIKAIVLGRHNGSVTARWKIKAWYDADGDQDGEANPVYEAEADFYPSLGFTEELAWEDDNWWDGKPLNEEIAGYAQNAIHILPEFVSAPNWRIEIIDDTNPDGFFQAARLFMAGGWQPSQNYAYGGSHGYETDTSSEKSLGGQKVFDRREPYRVARIGFEYLPEDEALMKGLDLCRRAGVDGEVFWIANPDNPRTLIQTSFLGHLRQLLPWEQVVFERANIAFEIEELL